HLENMQHLREGIHWRSVGQRDPLVEYRSESQKLFESLQRTLRTEVLRAIFNVRKSDAIPRNLDEEHETELTRLAQSATTSGVNEITSGEANRDEDFGASAKRQTTASDQNHKRNVARKKKKSSRQNRKQGR
ncbi:MAG: preprotein translocase subunit SecA, partial [Candidatus Saccharimonas sp.]